MLRNFRRKVTLVHDALFPRKPAVGRSESAGNHRLRFESLEQRLVLAQAGPGDLAISEINYHPHDASAGGDSELFEFVEFRNITGAAVELGGVRFQATDAALVDPDPPIDFTFPAMSLGSGDFVVIVKDRDAFEARYGTGISIAGEYATGLLSNSEGDILLKSASNVTMLDFNYKDGGNFPGRADGNGSTLELIDPYTADPRYPSEEWRNSSELGGSPGGEGLGPLEIAENEPVVVINEVLSHTDWPQSDAIELHNQTGNPVDITGWYLTDANGDYDAYQKFRVPDDDPRRIIPANGYVVFTEDDLDPDWDVHPEPDPRDPHYFGLSGAAGDDVWLMKANPDGSRMWFVDHVDFGGAWNGETYGRTEKNIDGDRYFYPMRTPTLGSENSEPRVGPVFISEIMYDRAGDDDGYEFIELFNPTKNTISLTESFPQAEATWRFRQGIDFDFPQGTEIGARSTLVIIRSDIPTGGTPAEFRTKYGLDASVAIVAGSWGSGLANGGEKLRLLNYDEPPTDEPDYVPHVVEDEVTYSSGGNWPDQAAGNGASLNRIAPFLWGNEATSWRAADPTPGSVNVDVVFPPYAGDDPAITRSGPGHDVEIVVLDNDSYFAGSLVPSTVEVTSGPANGDVSVNSMTGSVTYDPDDAFPGGIDTFRYTVRDSGGRLSNEAIVTVVVNDPPVANPDLEITTAPGTLVNVDVVANDTDHNGDPLWIDLRSSVHGTAQINVGSTAQNATDDTVDFAPEPGYTGIASFRYRVFDGHEYSNQITVEIHVVPPNQPPVANHDPFYTVAEDGTLTTTDVDGTATPANNTDNGVLANDTDPDGDPLSAVRVGNVSHGTLNLNSNGTFTYTPNTNFNGQDTFTYKAQDDDDAQSNLATVNISVTPVNDAPVITGQDVLSTPEETPLAITLDDLEVTDPDNAYPADFTLFVRDGTDYSRTGNTITPAVDFNGTLTVPVTVNDGTDDSEVFNLSVTVTPVNDAPVITGQDPLSTPEETPLAITLDDLEVTDPDNAYPADFTLSVQDGTGYGRDGNTITPAVDFNGTLTVPVTVHDGTDDSEVFNLSVTVTPVNDAPVITGQDPLSTPEETPLAITLDDLEVTDPDNAYPADFTLSVQDGTDYSRTGNTITPAVDFNGTLTVPVTVNDGTDDSNVFNLSVTVTAVNDPPVITGQDVLSTPEETPLAITLDDLEVTDPDNTYPVDFTLSVQDGTDYSRDGNTITPAVDFNGTLMVPVTVNDGTDDSEVFNLSVTVTPVNDPPVITGQDVLSTPEETPLAITLDDLEVTDPDNAYPADFTLFVQDGTDYGRDGNTITPAVDFNGTLTVPVTVNDGTDDSDVFNLSVMVTAVNDPPVITGQDALSTPEETPLAITLDDLEVTDPDNAYPADFTLSVQDGTDYSRDGNTITPAVDFNGTLTVPVTVHDGTDDSNVFNLSVTVTPVNDPPVITGQDVLSTPEETPLAITLDDLEVTDPDNAYPADFTLSVQDGTDYSRDGNTITPAVDFNGTLTVPVTVHDGTDDSNVFNLSVTVTPVNDPPVATDDEQTTDEDSSVVIAVLTNDTDVDGDDLEIESLDTVTTEGQVTNNDDGTLTYDPDGQFDYLRPGDTTTDEFRYTVSDGQGGSDTAMVTVTITGVNDAPVARAEVWGSDGVSTENINVLANDEDPENDPLTIIILESLNGEAVVNPGDLPDDPSDDTVDFTPSAEFVDTGSFTYRVFDGDLYSNEVTVTITLGEVNNDPAAKDDTAETNEETSVNVDVLANDLDIDGDTFTIDGVDRTGTDGTVTIVGDQISYDPAGQFEWLSAGATTIDKFGYTISDGRGGTDSARVTVTITGVNDPPVAGDDTATTDEDTARNISVGALLDNDTDPDSLDELTVTLIDDSETAGTVSFDGSTVTYDPAGQFEGLAAGETDNDTFTYTIDDGHGETATATVVVTITGVNDPPAAGHDRETTDEDTALDIPVATLLENDTDPDILDELTVTSIDDSETTGTVSFDGSTVTYDPAGEFEWLSVSQRTGDMFTYTITDSQGATATATVTVTITGVNDPPVAGDDTATTDEDTPLEISVGALLDNDTDPDSLDELTVTSINDSGTTGTVSFDGSTVTYDPAGAFEWLAAGETDDDTFTYTIGDDHGGTNTAMVTVTITGVNDPPVANDDPESTVEDTPVEVDVLGNDTDAENDPLWITILSSSHGTAVINDGGTLDDPMDDTVNFTPAEDFNGTASFTYRVNDGELDSNEATVSIDVAAVNDPPVADAGSVTTDEDTPALITLTGDDGDPELTQTLTFALGTLPSHGTLTDFDPDTGEVTYTPEDGYHGADSFTFTVNDGELDSTGATVTIDVRSVNHPPVAGDDEASTLESTPVNVDVLANDSDEENDPLAIVIVGATDGTAVLNDGGTPDDPADDTVDFTPAAGFSGTAGFTYKVDDGELESNEAAVSITVTSIADVAEPLGPITWLELRVDAWAGDLWYRFETTREGIVTLETVAGGGAQLALFDMDRVLLATSSLVGEEQRIDQQTGGGEIYYFKYNGNQADLHVHDIRLANLVEVSADGTQVTVHGTEGDDAFAASFAATPFSVTIKGMAYDGTMFPAATGIRFLGEGGSDEAVVTGSDADEAISLHPHSGTVTGPSYELQMDAFASMTVRAEAGQNELTLFDSDGNDEFVGKPGYGAMSGDGFDNRAHDVGKTYAEATGGIDVAKLYDSAGDDFYIGTPTYNAVSGEGFENVARYFEGVHVYATAGGSDVAKFYDSPGNDDYVATPTYAALFNDQYQGEHNATFFNRAKYFEGVHAYATAGGSDLARFYDSPSDDQFVATPTYAALFNDSYQYEYTHGFYNRAKYFRGAHAYATAGGNDLARLYDSPADDIFYADPTQGALYNDTYAYEYTSGFYNRGKFFEGVHAYATADGTDEARLHGSDSNDKLYANPTEVSLYKPGAFYNRGKYFERVFADAHEGDDDRALLYDSASVDLLEAEGNWARLSNAALDFLYEAAAFDYVYAKASNSGDTKDVPPPAELEFLLDLDGPWETP